MPAVSQKSLNGLQQSPVYSAAVDIENDDRDVYGETDDVWGWRTKPDPKLQLLNERLDKTAHCRQDSQKSKAAGGAIEKPQTTTCKFCSIQTTPLWHHFTEGRTLCNACCLFLKGAYGGALPWSSTGTSPKQTKPTSSRLNLSSSEKGRSHRLQVQCDHCFQKGIPCDGRLPCWCCYSTTRDCTFLRPGANIPSATEAPRLEERDGRRRHVSTDHGASTPNTPGSELKGTTDEDLKEFKVCRATSAAPFYFPKYGNMEMKPENGTPSTFTAGCVTSGIQSDSLAKPMSPQAPNGIIIPILGPPSSPSTPALCGYDGLPTSHESLGQSLPYHLKAAVFEESAAEGPDSPQSDEALSNDDFDWTSDYSESTPELEDIHPFRCAKPAIVQQALLAFQAWNQHRNNEAGTPDSSTLAATAKTGDSEETRVEQAGRRTRKRADEEDDGENGGSEKRAKRTQRSTGPGLSLACPFAKKDPRKYGDCFAKTIKRIQDVKQHLSRHHQPPIHCHRCKDRFETEATLYRHAEGLQCQPRREPIYDGINRDQKELLGRRLSAKMTLENQWFTIFDILFPGHRPRPLSPYVDTRLDLNIRAFREMMVIEGPRLIVRELESRDIALSMPNEERDLLTLMESVVANALQAIINTWLAGICPEASASQDNQDRIEDLAPVTPAPTSSDTLHLTGPSFVTQNATPIAASPTNGISARIRSSEQMESHPGRISDVLTGQDMVTDIPEVIELDVYPSWVAQDIDAFASDVNLDLTFDEDWLEHVLDSNERT